MNSIFIQIMIALLQDIFAFVDQIIPSPINPLFPYTFSPKGLNNNDDAIITATTLATFNILSYNINNVSVNSSKHRLAIIHAILSSNSDIILLQETNVEWEKAINAAELQKFQYTHYHHPGPKDRAAGGLAVLSQYPLKNVKILDFSRDVDGSVFPAMIFDVDIPIQDKNSLSSSSHEATIHIANVHLRPPVNLDGSAQLDTARKTEPIRVKEAKELIKQSTNQRDATNFTKQPLDIIGGDFNENDNRGGLDYLQSLGYKDALHHVPRRKETHTWPFGNMLTLRKRLDHILWNTSPLTSTIKDIKLKCLNCGVLTGYEEGASDHQPVLARCEMLWY